MREVYYSLRAVLEDSGRGRRNPLFYVRIAVQILSLVEKVDL